MGEPNLEQDLLALHTASFGWALACTGRNSDEASDVLQEAYAKVLSGRARFGGQSSFKTWLFGVIRLTAVEHKRWRFFRHRVVESVDLDQTAAPSARGVDRETSEALGRALATLSGRQREVLHLVFYQDLSIAEAAIVMQVALGTARLHYERGKANLLVILEKEGIDIA